MNVQKQGWRGENWSYLFAQTLACVIFGFSYLFTDRALAGTTPLVLLSWRFCAAALLMTALYLLRRCRRRDGKRKPLWPVLALGLFEPVLYFLLESYGLMHTSTAFSSVMLAMIPILSVALSGIVLRERPTPLQAAAILVSIGGVILVSWENTSLGIVQPVWALVLFGAMLSSACFVVFSRKLSVNYDAVERTFGMFAMAAVIFSAMALWENRRDPAALVRAFEQPWFGISVVYLGSVSSVAAFLLVNYANQKLPVVITSAIGNITPVISLLVGVLLLKEPFGMRSILGTGFIFAALLAVQLPSEPENRQKKTRKDETYDH